ncbi:Ger(x)C family spore germination C-terminal domain-containing protein [Paenibacillus filicis]|uniref:Ger(X)C family spore germination C-terminal domain-containing protein n=1 Tax=Paenibacillus filicis TaxID=669464 RepID=A0ABU9DR00_9BACL
MHRWQARSRKRVLIGLVVLIAWGSAGCTEGGPGERSLSINLDGRELAMAGIDEGPGGIRVTALRAASARPGSGIRMLAAGTVDSRSFVSLADASAPWRNQQPPRLVVIGESWVARHGFPASWAAELRRLGLRGGTPPAVAVVEGAAEDFIRRPDAGMIGSYTVERHGMVRDSLREARTDYEADQALPLFPAGLSMTADGKNSPVSVQTILFKKQELVGRLTAEETIVLACLRGGDMRQDSLYAAGADADTGAVTWQAVSCRTGVAANGDWKRPRLKISLHVKGRYTAPPGSDKPVAALYQERLKGQAIALIGRLQQLGVDPLRWGEATRAQFPGYWSADRWRSSWTRADIEWNIDTHLVEVKRS